MLTDSFNATAGDLKDFGLADKAYDINSHSARIAREASEKHSTAIKPRFVAGSMGPTTKTVTVTGGITFDQLRQNYHDQASISAIVFAHPDCTYFDVEK